MSLLIPPEEETLVVIDSDAETKARGNLIVNACTRRLGSQAGKGGKKVS